MAPSNEFIVVNVKRYLTILQITMSRHFDNTLVRIALEQASCPKKHVDPSGVLQFFGHLYPSFPSGDLRRGRGALKNANGTK